MMLALTRESSITEDCGPQDILGHAVKEGGCGVVYEAAAGSGT